MTSRDAFIAAHRFGLGPKSGELERIAPDPKGWLSAQVGKTGVPGDVEASMPSEKITRTLAGAASPDRQKTRRILREQAQSEVNAMLAHRIGSENPFAERMVLFWINHFNVSASRGLTTALQPSYEREAIRPHVSGRFADLLYAVLTHPAMIEYLDNNNSLGPNSPVGQRRPVKINENLARETLELYSLGVNGGYTQQDIIELAKILTGWSFPGPNVFRAEKTFRKRFPNMEFEKREGHAAFYRLIHEPGPKTVLGKTYRGEPGSELRAVVEDLAAHPSTARFLSTKLARHFVSDTPSENVIAKLSSVYLQSGGDLKVLQAALIELPEAWEEPLPKAKSPYEFLVAGMRAMGPGEINHKHISQGLMQMGQQLHKAPSPQGWPDTEDVWFAPARLLRRVEVAQLLAKRYGRDRNPDLFLEQTIGPVAGDEIRRVVRGAPSGADAIAFILASREFQRR
ncbi:DUF1800 domain-containing protein [Parvularcula sp. ZS-1/3]|uniref:DUF1800 domain-containing protein n=1 Tax=Parvularcula mediterranea TaxID=2732508 RepID=A0A7Y3RM12_9PROT|nr:DUF1800 domain-containing protein [Parvularcula mediterranea]NNU16450.1 DUF1800 domain-containing protein [Parvularcula mediterranea]